MGKTARGKQYTFEDVARLVCKGADPPEGLVRHLRSWARPMDGLPKIELEPPLGRKQMVDALKDLSAAADVILRGLAGQPMKFVMAPKYPSFDRILLIDLLWDLKRRCHDSVFSPPLSSAKGGVKRGPGHIAHPDGTNLMVFCAGAILLAWRVLHGAYPGSRNPVAAEAAEALFRLATGPPGKADSQPKRSSRGENPLTAWRRPFEVARAKEPILGPLHEIYLRNLRHALGMDEPQRGGDLSEREPPRGAGANSSA